MLPVPPVTFYKGSDFTWIWLFDICVVFFFPLLQLHLKLISG